MPPLQDGGEQLTATGNRLRPSSERRHLGVDPFWWTRIIAAGIRGKECDNETRR